MHKIESEEDIDALHGEIEGATLKIKGTNKAGELIKTERLIQIIQSFMNGAEPEGLIIIGVGENEQSELDSSKKCPIKFPTSIDSMTFAPESFAQYRDHVMKMLRSSTDSYTEGLCKIDRIKTGEGGAEYIVITVRKSILRPHRNKNGHYYIRLTEGRTEQMSTVEIEAEILKKRSRLQEGNTSFETAQDKRDADTFSENPFRKNRPIATLIPFGERENAREIRLMEGAEEYLWLFPVKKVRNEWNAKELYDLIYAQTSLYPLGRITGSWHERNEFGAIVFQESGVEPGVALNLAQVFFDGRLLGIDRFLLRADKPTKSGGLQDRYIPSTALEEDFENGLGNFCKFISKTLEIDPPYRFCAGVAGVEGYALAVPFGSGGSVKGNMIKNEVSYSGVIEVLDHTINDALIPFFELIWVECGLIRPKELRAQIGRS